MTTIHSIKRRLDKIEASRPKPDRYPVQRLVACEGDPCLDVPPPWGGHTIIRVLVSSDRNVASVFETAPDPIELHFHEGRMQGYADALESWKVAHG